MSIPYRTITQIVRFDFHGLTITGLIQASRTMLEGTLCTPQLKALGIVQTPLICCQACKNGLLNDDWTGLSDFGLRVARHQLEQACSWKHKNRALKASSCG